MTKAFGCTGLKIPLPGRWQLEFWYCPGGAEIPLHVHERVAGWIWLLAGKMKWQVNDRVREVKGLFRRRQTNGDLALSAQKIDRGVVHGGEVTGRFGLFVNVERWIGQKKSAADDLVLVARARSGRVHKRGVSRE